MTRAPDPGDQLTPRELDVLRLLADGHTLETAARRLFIARNTVKSHAANACKALGASGTTHAVALLARQERADLQARVDRVPALLAAVTQACAAATRAGIPQLLILQAALSPHPAEASGDDPAEVTR